MAKNNFKSKQEPHLTGIASKVRFFVMVLSVIFLLPSLSQADGLFDFQMKLAEKGNPEAQFKVGEMYETGFGVKQDMKQAMSWIIKADNQGHETAGFKLLYWDVEKNGITETNKATLEALKTKANEGNAQAQFYLGKMYGRGVGLKKNTNTAIDWLNKAALVGVLEAEREVALVREDKQRQALAKQRANEKRANEKKRAELKAKKEQEKAAKLEAQRKLNAKKQAEKKAGAAGTARQKQSATTTAVDKAAAEKAAIEAKQQADLLARKEAEAKKREAQKQALLKKRKAEKSERKAQFESDPCSGKSARFLSTCK